MMSEKGRKSDGNECLSNNGSEKDDSANIQEFEQKSSCSNSKTERETEKANKESEDKENNQTTNVRSTSPPSSSSPSKSKNKMNQNDSLPSPSSTKETTSSTSIQASEEEKNLLPLKKIVTISVNKNGEKKYEIKRCANNSTSSTSTSALSTTKEQQQQTKTNDEDKSGDKEKKKIELNRIRVRTDLIHTKNSTITTQTSSSTLASTDDKEAPVERLFKNVRIVDEFELKKELEKQRLNQILAFFTEDLLEKCTVDDLQKMPTLEELLSFFGYHPSVEEKMSLFKIISKVTCLNQLIEIRNNVQGTNNIQHSSHSSTVPQSIPASTSTTNTVVQASLPLLSVPLSSTSTVDRSPKVPLTVVPQTVTSTQDLILTSTTTTTTATPACSGCPSSRYTHINSQKRYSKDPRLKVLPQNSTVNPEGVPVTLTSTSTSSTFSSSTTLAMMNRYQQILTAQSSQQKSSTFTSTPSSPYSLQKQGVFNYPQSGSFVENSNNQRLQLQQQGFLQNHPMYGGSSTIVPSRQNQNRQQGNVSSSSSLYSERRGVYYPPQKQQNVVPSSLMNGGYQSGTLALNSVRNFEKGKEQHHDVASASAAAAAAVAAAAATQRQSVDASLIQNTGTAFVPSNGSNQRQGFDDNRLTSSQIRQVQSFYGYPINLIVNQRQGGAVVPSSFSNSTNSSSTLAQRQGFNNNINNYNFPVVSHESTSSQRQALQNQRTEVVPSNSNSNQGFNDNFLRQSTSSTSTQRRVSQGVLDNLSAIQHQRQRTVEVPTDSNSETFDQRQGFNNNFLCQSTSSQRPIPQGASNNLSAIQHQHQRTVEVPSNSSSATFDQRQGFNHNVFCQSTSSQRPVPQGALNNSSSIQHQHRRTVGVPSNFNSATFDQRQGFNNNALCQSTSLQRPVSQGASNNSSLIVNNQGASAVPSSQRRGDDAYPNSSSLVNQQFNYQRQAEAYYANLQRRHRQFSEEERRRSTRGTSGVTASSSVARINVIKQQLDKEQLSTLRNVRRKSISGSTAPLNQQTNFQNQISSNQNLPESSMLKRRNSTPGTALAFFEQLLSRNSDSLARINLESSMRRSGSIHGTTAPLPHHSSVDSTQPNRSIPTVIESVESTLPSHLSNRAIPTVIDDVYHQHNQHVVVDETIPINYLHVSSNLAVPPSESPKPRSSYPNNHEEVVEGSQIQSSQRNHVDVPPQSFVSAEHYRYQQFMMLQQNQRLPPPYYHPRHVNYHQYNHQANVQNFIQGYHQYLRCNTRIPHVSPAAQVSPSLPIPTSVPYLPNPCQITSTVSSSAAVPIAATAVPDLNDNVSVRTSTPQSFSSIVVSSTASPSAVSSLTISNPLVSGTSFGSTSRPKSLPAASSSIVVSSTASPSAVSSLTISNPLVSGTSFGSTSRPKFLPAASSSIVVSSTASPSAVSSLTISNLLVSGTSFGSTSRPKSLPAASSSIVVSSTASPSAVSSLTISNPLVNGTSFGGTSRPKSLPAATCFNSNANEVVPCSVVINGNGCDDDQSTLMDGTAVTRSKSVPLILSADSLAQRQSVIQPFITTNVSSSSSSLIPSISIIPSSISTTSSIASSTTSTSMLVPSVVITFPLQINVQQSSFQEENVNKNAEKNEEVVIIKIEESSDEYPPVLHLIDAEEEKVPPREDELVEILPTRKSHFQEEKLREEIERRQNEEFHARQKRRKTKKQRKIDEKERKRRLKELNKRLFGEDNDDDENENEEKERGKRHGKKKTKDKRKEERQKNLPKTNESDEEEWNKRKKEKKLKILTKKKDEKRRKSTGDENDLSPILLLDDDDDVNDVKKEPIDEEESNKLNKEEMKRKISIKNEDEKRRNSTDDEKDRSLILLDDDDVDAKKERIDEEESIKRNEEKMINEDKQSTKDHSPILLVDNDDDVNDVKIEERIDIDDEEEYREAKKQRLVDKRLMIISTVESLMEEYMETEKRILEEEIEETELMLNKEGRNRDMNISPIAFEEGTTRKEEISGDLKCQFFLDTAVPPPKKKMKMRFNSGCRRLSLNQYISTKDNGVKDVKRRSEEDGEIFEVETIVNEEENLEFETTNGDNETMDNEESKAKEEEKSPNTTVLKRTKGHNVIKKDCFYNDKETENKIELSQVKQKEEEEEDDDEEKQQRSDLLTKCLCGKAPIFVCRCAGVVYCSKQCQIKDWPQHSRKCQIIGDFFEYASNS